MKNSHLAAWVVTAGLSLGLMNYVDPLPRIVITALLGACVLIAMYPRFYPWLVANGVALLACVFIEPSPSDIIFVIAIPLGLITGAYQPKVQQTSLPGLLILLSFMVVSVPGLMFAQDQISALRYHLITFFLFLMALFLCTYVSEENQTTIIRAYLAAAIISFLAGLVGYCGLFQDLLMADEFRVKGLFKDPNVFGPFFVPAILILLDDLRSKKILRTSPLFQWLLIILLSLGVFFSYSRAAWINLIGSIMIYFLLNLKKTNYVQKLRQLLAVIAVFALVAFLFLQPAMSDAGITDFLQERAKLQNYDQERFEAQQGGLRLVIQNPLGYGPGQFESVIDHETQFKMDAHSLYVRTAVEHGVPGFLIFFTGIASIMKLLLSCHLTSSVKGDDNISPSAIIAIIFGILINSIVVDTIHWRHFWFFLGIGLSYGRRDEKELKK